MSNLEIKNAVCEDSTCNVENKWDEYPGYSI